MRRRRRGDRGAGGLRDWKKAFAEAFGVAPEAFYRDFEADRATR